ncbi:hypothetical protein WN944_015902 [Citrus x changshan-huyou]|uniref:TFIIS central domain-containing protein n=1 Tax=Citrus x changshan-huyou TaxID=2935761 RepID=A0AAP0QN14_9ROSI
MDMQRKRKKIATEKKVMELCEATKRAGAEEAQCLDALDQLQNCSITYQLLVSTQKDMFWDVDYGDNDIVVTKKAKVVKNAKDEEKLKKSTETYKFKYRRLLFNFNDPKNQEFRKKVLLGDVKPETIVMTAKEMASDKMQLWYENPGKGRAETNGRIFSGLVSPKNIVYGICKCGRCGHKRMYFIPLRRHITCLNCYQYWASTNPGIRVLPI